MMTIQSDPIGLIYAGGTFGSHGTPLAPLNTDIFLPKLKQLLPPTHTITLLPNPIIKDSSSLSPDDFYQFYQQLITARQSNIKKIVLITGTDTLAYLSAFLWYALSTLDITVVITGSMQPLLFDDRLEINPNSDAWHNLSDGLAFLQNNTRTGVFVSFSHQIFIGNSVQKISASDHNAFIGNSIQPTTYFQASYTIPQPIKPTPPIHCPIHTLYALPNQADDLALQLTSLLDRPPTALLLIGFGAGNLTNSHSLTIALKQLIQQGFLVIMTSQCPFGERSASYAAGAWQYELGVLSGGNLPIPALYGQALWLCLSQPINKRAAQWTV